jgi:hypothetical protein
MGRGQQVSAAALILIIKSSQLFSMSSDTADNRWYLYLPGCWRPRRELVSVSSDRHTPHSIRCPRFVPRLGISTQRTNSRKAEIASEVSHEPALCCDLDGRP